GIGPFGTPRPPRAGTAFSCDLAGCQGELLPNCNRFYRENGAVSRFRDSVRVPPGASLGGTGSTAPPARHAPTAGRSPPREWGRLGRPGGRGRRILRSSRLAAGRAPW